MFRIMIIEDDAGIREELLLLLNNHGYLVTAVTDFADAALQVRQAEPHLIILDINLPDTDGFQLCTRIRGFSRAPIIFVTSRNTDMDELNSITLGGDDFITKPYNTAILLARIASLLRRAYPDDRQEEGLTHKGVTLNLAAGRLENGNGWVELTKNEIKILHYLFLHRGKIVPRADLIEYLWDNELFVDDNTLSVNVTRIRGKLEQLGVDGFISTKRGQGYMI